MAVAKKKEPIFMAPPVIKVGWVKIGERHGDLIGDEFKPKNQTPKRTKKIVPVKGSVSTKKSKVVKKTPRVKKKTKKPSPKTIQRRTEYSEILKEELRLSATKAELLFKSNLELYEIEHEFQKELITNKSFIIADFYIPSLRLMVELDGGYHNMKEQKEKDRMKDIEYRNKGFKVLRMSNEQVNYFDFLELKESVVNKKPNQYLRKFIYK